MIAIGGAAVLLLLGLISPADAFLTLVRDWNTFLFFLGMMALSALAEAAGLFDWLAVQAARFAGKSAVRLFLNVFLLGSLTDTGPRHDIEHLRERFLRPPGPPPPREEEMRQAEKSSAQDILNEGLRRFPSAEAIQRQGRPEREIVNVAAEGQADLVIICPRAEYGGRHTIGPKSIGHVARFVVDHAPCPVLLVRPLAREQFPIPK
jgi:nucleotide-binding universal stress UspA family protein